MSKLQHAHSDAAVREVMDQVLGTQSPHSQVSRRGFLKLAGMTGGGLALAFYFGDEQDAHAQSSGKFAPNAYVVINPDNSVVLYSKGPEIGQGIKTAFALIIAEELDADWNTVRVEQAPVNQALYGNQGAGGSTSIPNNWDVLRQAGAVARAMLVSAAAGEWNVAESTCRAEQGKVLCSDGRTLSYGALAENAAALPVPDAKSIKLKERSQYQLLGKRFTGVDNHKVVTGQPLFGIDTQLPNMLYAVYEKCPAFGGKVQSANLDAIKQLPGVKDAFVVEGNGLSTEVMPGVAIIATSTWAAISARKQLRVVWDESSASKDNWNEFVKQAQTLSKQAGKETLRNSGDVEQAFSSAKKQVEAFYTYPYVSHATLEPQNCTAWYHDGRIEVWSPTQQATQSVNMIARLSGLSADKVTVHQTRVGGGFGRRLMNDYACEAAVIAKQVNAPVKLTWTREDDMAHDLYRVGGFHSFKGAVDAQGKLSAWQDHFISFTADGKTPTSGGNLDAEEFPSPLLPNVRLTQTLLQSGTPTGPLRAPRSNAIAFAIQGFLHELAVAAKRDHVEFLLEVMGEPRWLNPGNMRSLNTGRAAAVIKLAAEKSGWGKALPQSKSGGGRGLGLAFHFSHAGHVAEVAEVSVDRNKKLTVHKVTMAADVGPIINLSGAEAQAQGAIIDGFSMMFGQQITMDKGRVLQLNFNEYDLLRMPYAPQVEAHFIQSEYNPTGLGEPALPPLAPAIVNAIFAATGERVRSLPLNKQGFKLA